MRRVLVLGALAAASSGCGCGTKHHEPRVSATPVTEQVRQALLSALKMPTLADPHAAQRPRLPFVDVTACSGPASGGAGRYLCATRPRGRDGIRSITVNVTRDGKWSTQSRPVTVAVHGHRTSSANFGLFGFGIRLRS